MNGTADAKTIDMKWFGKWTPIQILGVFGSLVVAIVLTLFGFGNGCMCFGALIIAVILYMVPRMLGVEHIKLMALVGVLFLAVTLIVGGLLIAPDFVKNNQGNPPDNNYFTDVQFNYDIPGYDNGVQITASIKEGVDMTSKEVYFQYAAVSGIGLGGTVNGSSKDDIRLDLSGPTFIPLNSGTLHIGGLVVKDVTDSDNPVPVDDSRTRSSFLTGAFDGSITGLALVGTFMSVITIVIMFFIIMILSNVMKGRMEKTREQMEKDGRLYPRGHGRCQKCGSLVLPGEVTCRKCGEYIDRPDEIKPDKKDFFECSECGAEVPADAKQCPKCGAAFDEEDEVVITPAEHTAEAPVNDKESASKSKSVQEDSRSSGREPVVCPECGEVSPAGAWFCPRCGKSFDEKK
ncbi:MAG: zinc-ribbon domain-containing protein [Candidatus Methanoplasma sp.]|nr:zinc-ribbon domain-containing protein [Candidatus Methanoplasma sp.]